MTNDVSIKDFDGGSLIVGHLPNANVIEGLSSQDIILELEDFMRKAAEKAYRAGFEDFRNNIQQFINSDKKQRF